jgi:hypothetical protein
VVPGLTCASVQSMGIGNNLAVLVGPTCRGPRDVQLGAKLLLSGGERALREVADVDLGGQADRSQRPVEDRRRHHRRVRATGDCRRSCRCCWTGLQRPHRACGDDPAAAGCDGIGRRAGRGDAGPDGVGALAQPDRRQCCRRSLSAWCTCGMCLRCQSRNARGIASVCRPRVEGPDVATARSGAVDATLVRPRGRRFEHQSRVVLWRPCHHRLGRSAGSVTLVRVGHAVGEPVRLSSVRLPRRDVTAGDPAGGLSGGQSKCGLHWAIRLSARGAG